MSPRSREMQELAAYFYEHVFLAYHRYAQVKNDGEIGSNKDLRAAIDAAIALYHFREHIPQPCRKSWTQQVALCPDYGLLGDIANAAKHKTLTRGTPQVAGADDICEVLVCTTFADQIGEYKHEEKVVEVRLIDGSRRDILDVMTNVVNMWFDELYQIGAEDRQHPIKPKQQRPVSREDASSVALQITAGIRWQQQMRLQRYNCESGETEPIDLSDAKKIIFTIRKPQTFEVELLDASGVRFTSKVELTPEQARELEEIHDPGQRQRYLLIIAANQGVVNQMLAQYQNAENEEQQS